jgi:hypothetical protein
MNLISPKNPFGYELDIDSTCFHPLFAPFRLFLLFFVFSRRAVLVNLAADPNRIQREFLFNDAIASYDALLASSHLRQKTNLFKPAVTCAVKKATCVTLRGQESKIRPLCLSVSVLSFFFS